MKTYASITWLLLFTLNQFSAFSQSLHKIIDMHIHSYSNSDLGGSEPEIDNNGTKVTTAEKHRLETMAFLEKFNIVKAVMNGNPESVENIQNGW